MFVEFPKLTRFSHGWTVTEKLDGTNSQIVIADMRDPDTMDEVNANCSQILTTVGDFAVFAGSRNRLLTADKSGDNHGFARFVLDNAEALVEALGEGRHYGEWFGKGIGKRHYNLEQKEFALFNVARWSGQQLPPRVRVVPVLLNNERVEDFVQFDNILSDLQDNGSRINGYDNPEGIVMLHGPSRTLFKRTFDYDEAGKWAENQARRQGC